MLMPISEPTRLTWSSGRWAYLAAITPSGTPTPTANSIAAKASSTVAGKRSRSSSVTGLCVVTLSPKSPDATRSRYLPYCTTSGRSRPY